MHLISRPACGRMELMKVILKKSHKGLGTAGSVCEVKEGFARNFLIPQGIAAIMTRQARLELEAKGKSQKRKVIKKAKDAAKVAKAIAGTTFEIAAKANEEGHLFAKVGVKDIVAALAKARIDANPKHVYLDAPIKELGDAQARYAPPGTQPADIKLKITPA